MVDHAVDSEMKYKDMKNKLVAENNKLSSESVEHACEIRGLQDKKNYL